jgi:FkbM family methyltransferase
VDPSDSIGWGIYTRAIFETAVTEVLWRLARPGDIVVDGGSNIGYMASLLGIRVGPSGAVHCFEPHPYVFDKLTVNIERWRRSARCGSFVLYQAAIGERDGTARLCVADWFSSNSGTSFIGENGTIRVQVLKLDRVFAGADVALVKLDVQGYELAALQGMAEMISQGRLRNIVFEEEALYPADTHQFLYRAGYSIYGLECTLTGLRLVQDRQPYVQPTFGPSPSYLATRETPESIRKLTRGLWQSFGPGSCK